jgi:hypothetical protein
MYEPPDRVLVIDEDLNKRLATELKRRGRRVYSVAELGLKGTIDPNLLPRLLKDFPDPVLVTGDDHMPETHADLVAELKPTLAIVEPCEADDPLQDEYEREIVHRWVHKMTEQTSGAVIRYRLARPLPWKPRKR